MRVPGGARRVDGSPAGQAYLDGMKMQRRVCARLAEFMAEGIEADDSPVSATDALRALAKIIREDAT